MTASFYTINKKIIVRKTTLKMANFLIFALFIKPNKNVIRRMIRLRLVVFLLSGNKHFFVGKWINVQWILFSRSRTVNFPYIVPSPAGPRVSPYSSESPWPASSRLVRSIGRLLQRYRKGTGSNPVQVWILLRLSFHNCTEKLPLLITSIIFFTLFLHPVVLIIIQFSYWVFIGSTFC